MAMPDEQRRFGVCLLTETFHPVTGGGETQARALAEGLIGRSVAVDLVTRRSDRALVRAETVGGVPVHRIGPAGGGHLRKWGMVFTAFAELMRLRRRYDALLVCGFRVLGIPAMLVSLLSGKPCVLKADSQGELSGAFFDPGLARLGLRHDRFPVNGLVWLRNALLRRADRFVAISAVIEREYLDAGVPAARIVRIPNSVDPARFHPVSAEKKAALRQRLGIPAGRRMAVFTGRLVTTKGLPSLLRAWRSLVASHPDALLLLVGSGGLGLQNCEAELRAYVRDHALEDSVCFTGSVSNVQEFLQAADLFVFPTRREAFGISVAEAMACALPIVTTDVQGVSDVVRAGVDALVVPPDDDAVLASAITRALALDEGIRAMAAAARQRALECFTDEAVVAAYRDLLAGLLKR